ncbi:cistern family PEP-CTERM protein [Flavisphingomonas formosensis]|uniref:cistern family PEP-CTERM protein n=1 Tax=Flavisphingomonas formosensis TaxID=861534 RepID=UPI0012FCCD05|nr:cistern family PEP-CTERM protein [Sphingomonas formosensis]
MRLSFLLPGLCLALVATPAFADSISVAPTDIGKSFTLDYNGYTGAGTIDGLTGQTVFTLSGVSGNSYTFDYTVNNTSGTPITGSRISGFGFNTDPDIAGASSTGVFDTVGTGNAPNVGTVDVCFKGGGGTNNCAGGGGDGVDLGNSASGTLTLDFSSPTDLLSLSDFFVRYQSISGAGGISSAVGSGTLSSSGGGTPVPEPSALLLFGVGLAGLAFARNRSRPARRLALAA